jgi:hypothetical protein
MVDELPVVTEVGLNDTVTPDGAPVSDRDTVWLDPEVSAVLTVEVVDPPGLTEPDVGESAAEKEFPDDGGPHLPGVLPMSVSTSLNRTGLLGSRSYIENIITPPMPSQCMKSIRA